MVGLESIDAVGDATAERLDVDIHHRGVDLVAERDGLAQGDGSGIAEARSNLGDTLGDALGGLGYDVTDRVRGSDDVVDLVGCIVHELDGIGHRNEEESGDGIHVFGGGGGLGSLLGGGGGGGSGGSGGGGGDREGGRGGAVGRLLELVQEAGLLLKLDETGDDGHGIGDIDHGMVGSDDGLGVAGDGARGNNADGILLLGDTRGLGGLLVVIVIITDLGIVAGRIGRNGGRGSGVGDGSDGSAVLGGLEGDIDVGRRSIDDIVLLGLGLGLGVKTGVGES